MRRPFASRWTAGRQEAAGLQWVRVDKAKKLLQASDMSVKAIAYEAGYENGSYFVRLFKTQAGQTPAQGRQGVAARERQPRPWPGDH